MVDATMSSSSGAHGCWVGGSHGSLLLSCLLPLLALNLEGFQLYKVVEVLGWVHVSIRIPSIFVLVTPTLAK